MGVYSVGTVSVTNGSAIVTGSGTLWLAEITAGDGFTVAGTGVPYTVASVDSDTQITLSANYAGATDSGLTYAIWRDFTTNFDIPEMSQGDIETATIFTRAMRNIDGNILQGGQQAVADHEAEDDPHPQYTTTAEASAAAPVQSVDDLTGTVDLSNSYEPKRQNNLSATTDPTVTDDSSAGYEPLSVG